MSAISVSNDLMSLLVCPSCKGKLATQPSGEQLTCQVCKLGFPVVDGIPVLLVEKAEKI